MFDSLYKYYNLSGFVITLLNFIAIGIFFFYVFEVEISYIVLIALLLLLFILQLILFFYGILFGREKAVSILKTDLMVGLVMNCIELLFLNFIYIFVIHFKS